MYSTTIEISHKECFRLMREVFQSSNFDSYTIHKMVYGLYPVEDDARFMFDAEDVNDNGMVIRIYSDKKPVVTGLDNCDYRVKSIDLDQMFKEGETYRYEININAVKKHDSKYIMVRDDEFNDWFERKMNANGMTVEFDHNGGKVKAISIQRRYRRSTPTKTDHKGVPMHVAYVIGSFRILDINKFKEALVNGIGREKAFGLGMLRVKKI